MRCVLNINHGLEMLDQILTESQRRRYKTELSKAAMARNVDPAQIIKDAAIEAATLNKK